MKSCIYKIINTKNNHFYIGSTVDIDKRIRAHLQQFKNKTHHNVHLQRAIELYGEQFFIFHIIEFCDKSKLREYEQIYINNLKPVYNISKNTVAPMEGRKHSIETLNKYKGRSVWNKGIPRTDIEKMNISRGRSEMYKNMSEGEKLKRCEHLKKYTQKFKGRHHTEENKKYLRSIRKSKKRIICVETGEIFEAQLDITRKYGFKQGHVSECLNRKRKSVKGYTFKYED